MDSTALLKQVTTKYHDEILYTMFARNVLKHIQIIYRLLRPSCLAVNTAFCLKNHKTLSKMVILKMETWQNKAGWEGIAASYTNSGAALTAWRRSGTLGRGNQLKCDRGRNIQRVLLIVRTLARVRVYFIVLVPPLPRSINMLPRNCLDKVKKF